MDSKKAGENTWSPLSSAYGGYTPYTYTGRPMVSSGLTIHLYDLRNRMYHADLGRFLQPDPIGYAGGINLYAYCGNNPVNFIDPFGLKDKAPPKNLPDRYISGGYYNGVPLPGYWVKGGPNPEYQQWLEKQNAITLTTEEFFGHMRTPFELLNGLPHNGNFDIPLSWEASEYYEWAKNNRRLWLYSSAWDSNFWLYEGYKDQLFYYDGRYAYGRELNYFAGGMLYKHRGWSLEGGLAWVAFWKLKYGETPSENTKYFFEKGYNYWDYEPDDREDSDSYTQPILPIIICW